MSTESETRPDTAALTDRQLQEPNGYEENTAPRELESALLTIAMFGGLVVFAVGCMMFFW